jgi:hypothetical protein
MHTYILNPHGKELTKVLSPTNEHCLQIIWHSDKCGPCNRRLACTKRAGNCHILGQPISTKLESDGLTRPPQNNSAVLSGNHRPIPCFISNFVIILSHVQFAIFPALLTGRHLAAWSWDNRQSALKFTRKWQSFVLYTLSNVHLVYVLTATASTLHCRSIAPSKAPGHNCEHIVVLETKNGGQRPETLDPRSRVNPAGIYEKWFWTPRRSASHDAFASESNKAVFSLKNKGFSAPA